MFTMMTMQGESSFSYKAKQDDQDFNDDIALTSFTKEQIYNKTMKLDQEASRVGLM